MDNATTKLLLGAYRAGTQDKDDPFFAEALCEIEHDPELAGWFEEEQRFDALMVTTLKQAQAPAGLKELILLNAKSPAKPATLIEFIPHAWQRQTKTWLAAAAAIMLAFVLGRQTTPGPTPPPRSGEVASAEGDRLALQAIAYTGKMPALQFVCFDASVVAHWITEKSTAMHMGKVLDKPLSSMQMIGSSTAEWEGKPVIMVALQNKEQMAMLYLVRASDFPGISGNGEIIEKDGWVSKTGHNGEHLYVLTTKGTRANLNFPMPL